MPYKFGPGPNGWSCTPPHHIVYTSDRYGHAGSHQSLFNSLATRPPGHRASILP